MMAKRLLLWLSGLIGLTMILLIWSLPSCGPPVDWSLANQVHGGMTKDEVRAMLGPPHDRWQSPPGEYWAYRTGPGLLPDFRIYFDERGFVRASFVP